MLPFSVLNILVISYEFQENTFNKNFLVKNTWLYPLKAQETSWKIEPHFGLCKSKIYLKYSNEF